MAGFTVPVREALDSEECWALLERIAASSHLRRATRLQMLLQYLGKRSLKDHFETMHEQMVGVEVFGRPEGYDTSIDNIVRTNVSELRKRIDAYFNAEGVGETLIMEIPRWSYIPVFKSRPVIAQISSVPPLATIPSILTEAPVQHLVEAAPEARTVPHERHWMAPALLAAVLMSIALAAGLVYFWIQYRNLHRSLYAWQYEPSVAALWNDILSASPDTDVVLADASFGLLQDLNKKTVPFDDYLNRSYVSEFQSQNPSLSRIVRWNLGSQDEFKLAHRILNLDPLGKKIHLYNARDYMPDLTNHDNVILIGGRISNPWDDLFEGRMNFSVNFDNDGSIAVVNRAPATGEQPMYTQSNSVQYCVVGYLPNPSHNGQVLLIEGTGAEATEAAGNFLLSENQLSSFKKTLHVERLPYFEVLLKVSSVQGTPLASTVEAYRAYPNLH
jgi:hypothetical protein